MQFYLILPDIRSCHNVGAMFRTADAFGVDMIYLTGYTPCPPEPKIDKVSLGAEKWVPWKKMKSLKRVIGGLKKRGVFIVGLEKAEGSVDIGEIVNEDQRLKIEDHETVIALIVGNEVDGVKEDILEVCDLVVHIPMYGKKESLNVSIAAGIAMYVIKNGVINK
jgi:23S rRNA (guanosine2251-2'-O)-methyltransferase